MIAIVSNFLCKKMWKVKRVSSIFYSTRLIKFTLPRTVLLLYSFILISLKRFFFFFQFIYRLSIQHNIFYIYSMSLIFLNTVYIIYLNLERFFFVLKGLDWVLLYYIEDLSIKMLDLHLLNINALLVFLFFYFIF